jgi:TetR/AcrR family transcriptional regulator, acrAB operon repressor
MRRMDEIGQESRRRILDAAEELFAERGFDRTSFVDIAERSGISRGSIPWHFENKDGLLLAVFERAVERYVPADMPTFEAEGLHGVLEQIKKLMRDRTAAMPYMILVDAMSPDSAVHEQYVEFRRRRREGIARLLKAITRGHLPAGFDNDALAAVVDGALMGLHIQWVVDPTIDLDAAIEGLELMIERALGLDAQKAKRSTPRGARRRVAG